MFTSSQNDIIGIFRRLSVVEHEQFAEELRRLLDDIAAGTMDMRVAIVYPLPMIVQAEKVISRVVRARRP